MASYLFSPPVHQAMRDALQTIIGEQVKSDTQTHFFNPACLDELMIQQKTKEASSDRQVFSDK